jgi:hypothetical protein
MAGIGARLIRLREELPGSPQRWILQSTLTDVSTGENYSIEQRSRTSISDKFGPKALESHIHAAGLTQHGNHASHQSIRSSHPERLV